MDRDKAHDVVRELDRYEFDSFKTMPIRGEVDEYDVLKFSDALYQNDLYDLWNVADATGADLKVFPYTDDHGVLAIVAIFSDDDMQEELDPCKYKRKMPNAEGLYEQEKGVATKPPQGVSARPEEIKDLNQL